jgi:mono/diheme cytochrome c family protein
MNRLTVVLAFVTGGVMMAAAPASGQETKASEAIVVDKNLAKAGKGVWSSKGCMGCHMIGKKMAAPDLNGLYERRTPDWVKAWLKNPEPMFESDEAVKAMVKEYNGLKMPNMKLTDAQVDQVMHYIASEQKAAKK